MNINPRNEVGRLPNATTPRAGHWDQVPVPLPNHWLGSRIVRVRAVPI
jgi:hypothetical protein